MVGLPQTEEREGMSIVERYFSLTAITPLEAAKKVTPLHKAVPKRARKKTRVKSGGGRNGGGGNETRSVSKWKETTKDEDEENNSQKTKQTKVQLKIGSQEA